MLAPKKIEPKKLILYIVVIILTLGGVIYLIYVNFMPKEVGPGALSDEDRELAEDFDKNLDEFLKEEFANIEEMLGLEKLDLEKDPAKPDEGFFDFMQNEKFKNLKDNFSEIPFQDAGNRNPFESFIEE